jgi:hypothetical protein
MSRWFLAHRTDLYGVLPPVGDRTESIYANSNHVVCEGSRISYCIADCTGIAKPVHELVTLMLFLDVGASP